jgi:glycosyltransferase involved in cell wall biosynthesis
MVLANIEKRSVSTEALLLRLNDYGEIYRSMSGAKNARLQVFATYKSENILEILEADYEFLHIHPVKAHSWQLIRQVQNLKNFVSAEKSIPRLLIAGDPMLGFIISFTVILLTSRIHQLQVQFHGDIYLKPKEFKLKNYIRWALARFQISVADSIRVVSSHQALQIADLNPDKDLNLVIAPIPINRYFFESRIENTRINIGFIGRLHPERGVALLQEIVSKVMEIFPGEKIHIIGEGPSRALLENAFQYEIEVGGIVFLGWLNQEKLLSELKKMKLLLSTAPTEGYGLAIREAVLSGVQVLARKSGGARLAQVDFPESVFLFDDVEGAIKLIADRNTKEIPMDAVAEFRKRQELMDQSHTANLIKSWI